MTIYEPVIDKTNYPAVRAFRRLAALIIAASSEAERADAGFDAGEWSGPAHASMLEGQLDQLERRVAERFGLTKVELMYMCMDADYQQDKLFMLAQH